jgi:hypothetical protein
MSQKSHRPTEIRDQLRRARGRGKAFERAGSSRGGGILGRIEGVAAPAYISLPFCSFFLTAWPRLGHLPAARPCVPPRARHAKPPPSYDQKRYA